MRLIAATLMAYRLGRLIVAGDPGTAHSNALASWGLERYSGREEEQASIGPWR